MSATKVVSFRIDEEQHQALVAHAAGLGRSASEAARELVVCGLVGGPTVNDAPRGKAIEEELESVRRDLKYLREDLLFGIKAILVTAARVPIAEVDKWIAGQLGGRNG